MNHRRRFRASAVCLALAAAVIASTAMNVPGAFAASTSGDSGRADVDWLSLGFDLASPFRPIIDALDGDQAINKGTDGRLTFLLLGSDARGTAVSRTDSMMIMSIKGNTITSASLPRDTGLVPRPSWLGGGVFPGKANGILRQLTAGTTLDNGLDKFERVIEDLLGIEIDYHALIWFDGFTTLVSKIDPITVNSEREIRDQSHRDGNSTLPGVYFPVWNGYALYAMNTGSDPYCNGKYKAYSDPRAHAETWCHRALPYVRSRHGPYNDDWVRSRRQQEFIVSAIKAVSQSELSSLVSTAQSEGKGKWWTNFPISATTGMDLYNALHNGSHGAHVVFKPSQFASRVPGTSKYELKLSAVRAWSAQYLK